ncbi:NAD(P)H-dependent flavin oxidoreductase [Salibacterium halotolerans]|uniref:Probable nitronate monooxygenase n=1 Tax=Salibacterium halotolerans TaxID=1884432 RepID=A0A1I5LYX2_9BACI|nr:enoyl-[acyl-carrier protein] reductase II [Salibacterium halotolerans]
MLKTSITELLNIRYPIIQGGLAYLAYSDLASAVSNSGGLGQITAMSLPDVQALKQEIRRVRQLTSAPFGVNIAIGRGVRPYEEMVKAAVFEEVDVLSITGGNPVPVLDMLKGTNIKALVLTASIRQAVKAEEAGADAVMIVGREGGGHVGRDDTGTMVLVPQVVDRVSIPVIASGGISDGRSMMAAMALGAEGVEMGTRFIAVKECVHAHPAYQQALTEAAETDTVVIKESIGAPGRVLKNEWTKTILAKEQVSPSFETLRPYIGAEANKAFIYDGKDEDGFGWAGQVTGRIHDIPSVQELFDRIVEETEQVKERWNR